MNVRMYVCMHVCMHACTRTMRRDSAFPRCTISEVYFGSRASMMSSF